MERVIRTIVVTTGTGLVMLGLVGTAAADAQADPATTSAEAAAPGITAESAMTASGPGMEAEAADVARGKPGPIEEHVAVVAPDDASHYAAANDPSRYPYLDVPTKPWAYDTAYFFGVTRGLQDEDLPKWGEWASMAGTIPLDVVGLPTAALAGLFGS